jgi:cardiolipin hydrolase
VGLPGSQVAPFLAKGAFVRFRKMDYIMHHKFVVIDGAKVLSGSFNWTMQAVMGNKENVIVTEEPEIVAPFAEEFESLWKEIGSEEAKAL